MKESRIPVLIVGGGPVGLALAADLGWLGEGKSTIDLFGRGFVLLRLGAAPADADGLVTAAAQGVPLRVVDIADPAIAELYQRRLILVRPDGHGAWRADECPGDGRAGIELVCGAAETTYMSNG